MSNLAVLYATDEMPEEPDPMKRARELYGRAAEGGNLPAAKTYGIMCMFGEGGSVNLDSAQKWLTVAAADGKNLGALVKLGLFHATRANPTNIPKARMLWKKAKALYQEVRHLGTDRREKEVQHNELLQYWQAFVPGDCSIEEDDNKSDAATTTIIQQAYTYIDQRDEKEKVCGTCSLPFVIGANNNLLTFPCCASIRHSDCVNLLPTTSASIMNNRCPLCSKQLKNEGSKAMFQSYVKSAKNGVAWAQTYVGCQYLRFRIHTPLYKISRSIEKGLKWYKLAAKNGDPHALYILGLVCRSESDGGIEEVPISLVKTHMYWELAAQAGHVLAMHRLGLLYMGTEEGNHTLNDLDQAKKWLQAAADLGDEDALEMVQQWNGRESNSRRLQCCDICGIQKRQSQLKTCTRCGNGLYCGRACFADHWPVHKKVCKRKKAK